MLICIGLLISAAVLFSNESVMPSRIITEIIVLALILIINFSWVYARTRTEKTEKFSRLRAHLRYFEKKGDPLEKGDIHKIIPRTSIDSAVTVLRNNIWTKIPLNLVVKGDIVGLLPSDQTPLAVKCVDERLKETQYYKEELKRNDIVLAKRVLKSLSPLEFIYFEALETPAIKQLQMSISQVGAEPSILEGYILGSLQSGKHLYIA